MNPEPSPRAVAFGELLLRLSPPGEERLLAGAALLHCFGGAEANVAVALSHLGVPCQYVTRLPSNLLGDAAFEALRREGVGTGGILRGGQRLGIYFVEPGADLREMRVVYDRGGSAFAQVEPGMLDWTTLLAGAAWFHSTGITAALGSGPAAVLAEAMTQARGLGIPVSLDLNYREALWQGRDPRPLLAPLARQADLLIGNPAAFRAMLGVAAEAVDLATADQARAFAARLAGDFGCKLVALTRREVLGAREHGWSAFLYEAESGTLAVSRRYQMRVVDRTGGGDSFAAALISRLLRQEALATGLEFAVAAGALKLTMAGDWSRAGAAAIERFMGSGAPCT